MFWKCPKMTVNLRTVHKAALLKLLLQGVRAGGGDDRVGQVLDSGEVHGATRHGGGQAGVRYPLLPALPRQAGHLFVY
jgi:hypothetical protein